MKKNRTYFSIDVEADGPAPGLYSMVSFGAVIVDDNLDKTFYGKLKPISNKYISDALNVSGHSRLDCYKFDDPEVAMKNFADWIKSNSDGQPMFISDNNGFDWQFINYYFHAFTAGNPFGHSSTNLGSLTKGLFRDTRKNHKRYRKTKHSHNPVDDAKGNAEAFIFLARKLDMNIQF